MAWMDIALLSSVLISWIAVAMALFCLVRLKRQSALTQKLYKRLHRDLSVTNDGSVGMGQRLVAMEKRLKQIVKQQRQLTEQAGEVREQQTFEPYTQAASLFNCGLDADEVARRCNLSRAEASLLQAMQGNMAQASRASFTGTAA